MSLNAPLLAGPTDFLATVARAHEDVRKSKVAAKAVGQFFTPPSVARFIAGLVKEAPSRVRVLDPGAGAGILTAALCEELTRQGVREIVAHAYETDDAALAELDVTLASCRSTLEAEGRLLESHVHARDFVLEGPLAERGLFGSDESLFDVVIMNPPYQKIARDSRYAHPAGIPESHPNLYALFMSIAARVLRPGGQMLAIVPRSFANGPYFAAFRKSLFSEMAIERVHVFNSRRTAFADAGVLQENVIVRAVKGGKVSGRVQVSSSDGPDADVTLRSLPRRMVLPGPGSASILRLPTTDQEVEVLKLVDQWPVLFSDLPLRISTGPVVAFRAREYLAPPELARGRVPLYTVQSVRRFATAWPGPSIRKARSFTIGDGSRRLLVGAMNMVLLRRFSAKEEATRLTASPLYGRESSGEGFAIENHVNYVVHTLRELKEVEVEGLVALFNSKLLDIYFRSTSGNTQVNASDIRAMPFPAMDAIAAVGEAAAGLKEAPSEERERVVLSVLGVEPSMQDLIVG